MADNTGSTIITVRCSLCGTEKRSAMCTNFYDPHSRTCTLAEHLAEINNALQPVMEAVHTEGPLDPELQQDARDALVRIRVALEALRGRGRNVVP